MPLILGTNSIKDTGYDVANSLRFDDGSSDYLERTAGSTGNRKTLTISYWLKRSNLTTSNSQGVLNAGILSDGNNHSFCGFEFSTDTAIIQTTTSNSNVMSLQSNALFRDVSAWYNFVWKVDTTQGTESNRIKLYVNGVEHSLTGTFPSLNQDTWFNYADKHQVGTRFANYLNGYLTEMILIDGTALDPTSFGEFDEDTGIWKPIDVSGLTFGTNGFYLDFENSGSLGADVSGNGNNFTVNNLTSIDQSTDTCTNNFATMNSLYKLSNVTFSEGNLQHTNSGNWQPGLSTIGVSSGKWYFESKFTAVTGGSNNAFIGISLDTEANGLVLTGNSANSYGYEQNGDKKNNSSGASYGDSWTVGDIVSCYLDLDNGAIYFGKNGTVQASGDPTSGASKTNPAYTFTTGGTYVLGVSNYYGTQQVNYGSPPFTISSGNTDGNGYGNFEFAVPSGYFSLCTKNLAEYG